jgi:3-methyladenine DNA glycosylase/8-oxoguanine DNA glycosylase
METMQRQLRTEGPIHLAATVRSHGWWQLPPFAWDEEHGILRRTEHLGEAVVELELRQAAADAIELGAESERPLSAAEWNELARRSRWMLAVDQDLGEFYELCRSEPRLAHVPAEGRGRFLRSSSLFEDTVKTICTTNTTWAQTKGMVRRLVERLGPSSALSEHHAFPTPLTIAGAGEGVLRDEVRLGYRAPYVHELSQQIAAGDLDLEALRTSDLPTAELRKQLLRIKGIGSYAAASLLMLVGRYDYIGVDSWAKKLVSKQFYDGQPVGEKEIQAAFEGFGKWRALAYWFYRYDET